VGLRSNAQITNPLIAGLISGGEKAISGLAAGAKTRAEQPIRDAQLDLILSNAALKQQQLTDAQRQISLGPGALPPVSNLLDLGGRTSITPGELKTAGQLSGISKQGFDLTPAVGEELDSIFGLTKGTIKTRADLQGATAVGNLAFKGANLGLGREKFGELKRGALVRESEARTAAAQLRFDKRTAREDKLFNQLDGINKEFQNKVSGGPGGPKGYDDILQGLGSLQGVADAIKVGNLTALVDSAALYVAVAIQGPRPTDIDAKRAESTRDIQTKLKNAFLTWKNNRTSDQARKNFMELAQAMQKVQLIQAETIKQELFKQYKVRTRRFRKLDKTVNNPAQVLGDPLLRFKEINLTGFKELRGQGPEQPGGGGVLGGFFDAVFPPGFDKTKLQRLQELDAK